MRIGSEELSAQVDGCSEAIILSLSSAEMEQENNLSSEISNKARRIKDIEDYLRARPRAVVGWCSKRNQFQLNVEEDMSSLTQLRRSQ